MQKTRAPVQPQPIVKLRRGEKSARPGPFRSPEWHLPGQRALELLLFATIILTPLVVDIRSKDPFRYPKELLVRAGSIFMGAAIVSGMIIDGWKLPLRFMTRHARFLLSAIVVWTGVTAITAVNHVVATASAATVGLYAILFISMVIVAQRRKSFIVAVILLIPAVMNSLVLLLQACRIWSPFSKWLPMTTLVALLGNSDDVGGYLAPLVIIALAAGLAFRSRLAGAAAILILAAVIGTQTRTAIVAVAAGVIGLTIVKFGRRAALPAVLAAVAMIFMLAYAPVGKRMWEAVDHLRKGNVNVALSGRLTAFQAAIEMVRDHPVLGVGPGCYGFEYFDYKIRAEVLYPSLQQSMSRATNFAEAHNDHLQIASETGIPGYLLFLASLLFASERSFHGRGKEPTAEFARLAGVPTATVLFVSSFALFPLQLAASTVVYVCVFGMVNAWSTENAAT